MRLVLWLEYLSAWCSVEFAQVCITFTLSISSKETNSVLPAHWLPSLRVQSLTNQYSGRVAATSTFWSELPQQIEYSDLKPHHCRYALALCQKMIITILYYYTLNTYMRFPFTANHLHAVSEKETHYLRHVADRLWV